jgi:hypothetical protein
MRFVQQTLTAALVGGVLLSQPALADSHEPAASVQQIGENAYLYGLQQAIFYGQRWIYTQDDSEDNISYAGLNRFYWVREKITPDFPVVTPNATTLYGSGFMDLREGPVVIEMPEITDRYYSSQVMDQYGIFRHTVGSPFNGTDARSYVFLPAGYEGELPSEFATTDIVYWPSLTAYALVRVALMEGTDEEIATINAFQDAITMTPLKDWRENDVKGVLQAEREIIPGDFPVPERLPKYARGQVDKQTAEDFFTLLQVILNDPTMTLMPDSSVEEDMLAQLASIGIGKGTDFEWSALDNETRAALEAGFKAGFESVRQELSSGLVDMNGWGLVKNAGNFETRWLDRALMADVGWAGPDTNRSHSAAFLFTDSNGEPLNGANKYTLTFDLDNLPPVTQFWSIPIYNAEGYFVANEIDRYTINSFMLDSGQLYTEDNKLVIYVQTEKPEDPNQAKNWLPAPPEGFRFTARFYGPYPPVTEGTYDMPQAMNVE